jgi:hypothetical protein
MINRCSWALLLVSCDPSLSLSLSLSRPPPPFIFACSFFALFLRVLLLFVPTVDGHKNTYSPITLANISSINLVS